jgi:hypothetical protein
VNPEHLKEGTQKENMDDCKAKGRMYRPGAKNPARGDNSKNALINIMKRRNETIQQVLAHKGKPKVVAEELGLNYHWVRDVRNGKIVMQEL